MEKKTIRDMYNQLKTNYALTADEIAFIDGRIAQLDKKSAKKAGPTATQLANAKIGEDILAFMADKSDVTIATVRKAFDLSPQKITPIMGNLVDAGKVTKVTDKRTSYFNLVK